MDRARGARRGEFENPISLRGETPIIDPRHSLAIVESRFAEGAAARLLFEAKLLTADVGDREVRELQVVDDEARGVRIAVGRRLDSVAEKRQLVTEPMAIGIEQIAGKIPPLGFEFAMRVVVPGKFVPPAGLGDFPISRESSRRQKGN